MKFSALKLLLCTLIMQLWQTTTVGQSVLVTDLHLTDVAYHPGEDRLYGLSPSDRYHGNNLLIIDPATAVVYDTIPLEASPGICRFDPSFRYLYIAYLGNNKLDRWDTATRSLTRFSEYTQATEELANHNLRPSDIVVLPEERIVVATRFFGTFPEDVNTLVLTPGASLPNQLESGFQQSRALVWHQSSNYVYGFGQGARDGGLLRYSIDESGIQLDETFDLLRRDRQHFFEHEDKLYFQYGDVVDISGATPAVVGNYRTAIGNPAYSHGVAAINADNDMLYVIDFRSRFGPNPAGNYLHFVDTESFTEIERRFLPDVPNELAKMISTGNGRFAIISKENEFLESIPVPGSLTILGACANAATPEELTLNLPQTGFCVGDTLFAQAPANYEHIRWMNETTEEQLVLPLNTVSTYEIGLKAYDNNGCLIASSPTTTISAVEPPTMVDITGPAYFCEGEEITLTVTASGADRFEWSHGDTGPSITISEAGTYQVQAYQGGCTKSLQDEFTTNYHATSIPTPTVIPGGERLICFGDTINLHVSPPPLPYTIEWSHNNSQVPTQTIASRGDYSVRYRDPHGCYSSPSVITSVQTSLPPARPDVREWIENELRILPDDPSHERQWFRNDIALIDSTNATIMPDTSGYYTVRVRQPNFSECWSVPSVPIWYEGIDPAETDNRLRSQVFVDYNENARPDGEDVFLSRQGVQLDLEQNLAFTNESGQATFFVSPDTYTLSVIPDMSLWEPLPGLATQIADVTSMPDSIYSFPIRLIVDTIDATISLTASATRCNEPTSVWLTITNTGTRALTGEFCVILDPLIQSLIVDNEMITPLPAAYCHEVIDLPIGQSMQQKLILGMPNEQFTGQDIILAADLSLLGTTRQINTEYSSVLRCAYDPNDKLVSPNFGFGENYARFSDTLFYTIRFQNTGNDTARNVRLEDQLSEDLQWETFFPVAASHPYEVALKLSSGELEVRFYNIMLPDSNVNLTGSQGFFKFGIMAQPDLEDFSVVNNTAGIYFDFNAPIITNTIMSTMVTTFDADNDGYPLWIDCRDDVFEINPGAEEVPNNGLDDDCIDGDLTGTAELLASGLKVFPNPTTGLLQLTQRNPLTLQVSLYSSTGQLLSQHKIQGSQENIDLNTLPAGVYFLQIQSEVASGVFRIVRI